jgi:hypothetical protein
MKNFCGPVRVLCERLKQSPQDGIMLFALAAALKAQGKFASEVQRGFDAAWAQSDVNLSLPMRGTE